MDILLRDIDDEHYFVIMVDVNEGKIVRNTSRSISETLGLSIEKYNGILIEKVIRHDSYRIEEEDDIFGECDLFFYAEGVSKETYVERFKEVFLKELTTFALNYQLLGDDSSGN